MAASEKIPEFSSIEEVAEFWDTHDITDYLHELKPVELRLSPGSKHSFVVSLEPHAFHALGREAERQGRSFIELAEQWLLDRLPAIDATPRPRRRRSG